MCATKFGLTPVFVHESFTPPTITATDAVDGDVNVSVTGTVNTSVIGEYVLTYTATDSSNNTATMTITVTVHKDQTAPVINYSGSTSTTIVQGGHYTIPTITAVDNVDGYVTANYTVTLNGIPVNTVTTNTVGTYVITYTATDSAGNTSAPLVITVRVIYSSSSSSGGNYYPSYNYPNFSTSSSVSQVVTDDDEDEDEETEQDEDVVTNTSSTVVVTPTTPIDISKVFSDVAMSDWFYADVASVYTKGLIRGVTDTEFMPYESATRAQLATILHRLDGNVQVPSFSGFLDVSNGAWYTPSIAWATNAGIYNGYEDGTFRPDLEITREQLVTVLHNYAHYKGYNTSKVSAISSYSDSDQVSAWATPAMQWAVGNNIIGGKDGNILDPSGTATRAEIAAIITRFINNVR
ncbi:MAG: hypothetical protein ATN33_05170 [Epulopiscium sp. Nele67-Bin001]|nr:MAG: hypothetical protein ATN33_05170 [Epulopiscium sp. Nele67-Bin001]